MKGKSKMTKQHAEDTETALCGFHRLFKAMTGHDPFGWQKRLYLRFLAGELPDIVDMPTSSGKTSVIIIWLIALANGAAVPRRLFYIVNRRTVVDQATAEAEVFRGTMDVRDVLLEEVEEVRRKLLGMCSIDGDPLAVSTLRGELADNGEWKIDPARLAIVVGTIDMIGSKLLFSGYGDRLRNLPHHAGLVGRDSLVVFDEAHLSPAFGDTLRSIRDEQVDFGGFGRRMAVMEMSATRRGGDDGLDVFSLDAADYGDSRLAARLNAVKVVRVAQLDGKTLVDWAVAEAMRRSEGRDRVLVYLRSPADAKRVCAKLRAKLGEDTRVGLLTGTIRGYERDRLVKSDLFAAFKANPNRGDIEKTMYLVCTSAGEIGVDLDADHAVCDLTELDSLLQRFGRVNRLGGDDRRAEIVVAQHKFDKENEKNQALTATLEALLTLPEGPGGFSVSPADLSAVLLGPSAVNRDLAVRAFSTAPRTLPLSRIEMDKLSLTSVAPEPDSEQYRPDAQPYLHGVGGEPPETYIVWRDELPELYDSDRPDDAKGKILRAGACARGAIKAFRTRAAETLRETTKCAAEQIADIAERHPGSMALLVRGESVDWVALSGLGENMLRYATVLLPSKVGGLTSAGYLDGKSKPPVLDVAEVETVGCRPRIRAKIAAGEDCKTPGYSTRHRVDLRGGCRIEYRVATRKIDRSGGTVSLGDHAMECEMVADRIAAAAELPPNIRSALILAARWHDSGKSRSLWQRYAKNPDHSNPLAKFPWAPAHWRFLDGYRHEFASSQDARDAQEVASHPEQDLVLHLISSHHGRARPHFRVRGANDPEHTTIDNREGAEEVLRRFDRLQRRFGRWGLAWLESLLRCADEISSDDTEGCDEP